LNLVKRGVHALATLLNRGIRSAAQFGHTLLCLALQLIEAALQFGASFFATLGRKQQTKDSADSASPQKRS